MRSLVVFESMYGHTHQLADRIAAGLRAGGEAEVVAVGDADADRLGWADLVVVGGPTHVHGMSTTMSRTIATSEDNLRSEAEKGHDLDVDPDAEGPGLREWFKDLPPHHRALAAAFDTRLDKAAAITGRASRGIRRKLAHHGFDVVAEPESFLVDEAHELLAGEAERAEAWAATLLEQVARRSPDLTTPPAPSADDGLDEAMESGGRFAGS